MEVPLSDEGIFAGYWPLAITLFSMTFGLFVAYFLFTRFKAQEAEHHDKHFGGVQHRSIYADLDTGMSARERLDQRSDGRAYRENRTKAVLYEERMKAKGEAEPAGGLPNDPTRVEPVTTIIPEDAVTNKTSAHTLDPRRPAGERLEERQRTVLAERTTKR